MRIAFLGAAQTVTGSQHLITIGDKKILLDCGLYQGKGAEAQKRNREFDFDPREIDAVLLSHAHIDHSGNLPGLVKQGYEGPIYATRATAHLADIMLRDSAHIQEMEAAEVASVKGNGKNGKGKSGKVEPLYEQEDAARVMKQFEGVSYNREFEPAPGVTATFVEAGHILGSAAIRLELRENGTRHKLWFSGDIGRRNLPLIKDPVLPEDVDTLIMECTYGDKSHEDPLEALDELQACLVKTIERGGKVIIPAFAVGRTQEIVYDIHQMIERGDLKKVPVYVDSPLAVEASKVFSDHKELFDDETWNFLREADSWRALGFDMLTYVESVEQSKEISEKDEPSIIISASGMAETGRVVHHIRNNIRDPRTTILIVSYQAPDTLGRALAECQEQVEVMGRVYERKADVQVIAGLSAHAGKGMLKEYALAVRKQAKQVFLVHGEQKPAEALRDELQDSGMRHVYYPYLRQVMEV